MKTESKLEIWADVNPKGNEGLRIGAELLNTYSKEKYVKVELICDRLRKEQCYFINSKDSERISLLIKELEESE